MDRLRYPPHRLRRRHADLVMAHFEGEGHKCRLVAPPELWCVTHLDFYPSDESRFGPTDDPFVGLVIKPKVSGSHLHRVLLLLGLVEPMGSRDIKFLDRIARDHSGTDWLEC